MIEFTQPTNLNGAELLTELHNAGVTITEHPFVDGNNKLWLTINLTDKVKAAGVVAAHKGTIIAPHLTIAEKLASVGLSLTDLKQALGLGGNE